MGWVVCKFVSFQMRKASFIQLLYDKAIVLESDKRAWENLPEAQAMREALTPWINHDAEAKENL
ncbi:hypothetical protein ACJRO7_032238 [Eucalyptus globulus]|uniref:Uncharacterized protein n=1 Tax=Eucalyptus globulus TaxID=34317 RepID=A0ABD3JNS0_EUCGL